MKKFLFFAMLIPVIASSQTAKVIGVSRFIPKIDKVAEFEDALANHSKHHTGDYKWRVYSIESGPDAGGYLTVEGPASWDQIDKRGNIGKEHTADLYKNLLPLCEKSLQWFLTFREDLSNVAQSDYTDKISIIHVSPKVGKSMQVEGDIKQMLKVWKDSQQSVAVYESSSSGPAEYYLVFRYKEGLKEREPSYRKPVMERFETTNGKGSFQKWTQSVSDDTQSSWSELLFYSPELSSK